MKQKGALVKYLGNCTQVRQHYGSRKWQNVGETLEINKEYEILSIWCMQNEDYSYYIVKNSCGENVAVATKYFDD